MGLASPTDSDEPAVTFLALSDMGCEGSNYRKDVTPDTTGAKQVTDLISTMIDQQHIDSIHHIGDLAYADGAGHLWDMWLEMIQPYASRVPVMVGIGNHEYDHTTGGSGGKDPSGEVTEFGFQPNLGVGSFNNTGGECGVPISKRFAVPENGNGVFWYSYDQSLIHTVMLSSEHNITKGSKQYVWLEKDLESVDRSLTPWLVVEIHRPVYNSEIYDWSGPIVTEGLQNEVEDLFHLHQVDLVLSGHYHSYFRSCDGLFAYKCNNGGPTYVTVGTGGAPLDSNASTIIPNDYTKAFDRSNWGVGRASVYNASMLHWEFVSVGEASAVDDVWLMRDR